MTCVFKWKTGWNVSHNRIFNQHMSEYLNDALHCACRDGQKETALELIDLGADIDAKNKYGGTPLHYACDGYVDIVQILIVRGADISAKKNDGDTPLHLACYNGHRDTVLALIDIFADIDAKNNDGRTPLHYACRYGQFIFII